MGQLPILRCVFGTSLSLAFIIRKSFFFPITHFHILSFPCSYQRYPCSLLQCHLRLWVCHPKMMAWPQPRLLSEQQEVRCQHGKSRRLSCYSVIISPRVIWISTFYPLNNAMVTYTLWNWGTLMEILSLSQSCHVAQVALSLRSSWLGLWSTMTTGVHHYTQLHLDFLV
jgi:hypothetical protein